MPFELDGSALVDKPLSVRRFELERLAAVRHHGDGRNHHLGVTRTIEASFTFVTTDSYCSRVNSGNLGNHYQCHTKAPPKT